MNIFRIEKILRVIFVVSLAVFCVSLFQKKKFPDKKEILEQLYSLPVQRVTNMPAFVEEKGENKYSIVPLYDYELYGLVVSHLSTGVWWNSYHRKHSDFINTKDICVIWADNIRNEVYKGMEFWSQSFTCNMKYTNRNVEFRGDCLSNNHILPKDERIYRKINQVERGDQIYLKGYLVNYGHAGSDVKRKSSITREDNGCEVIYVNDFKILKRANQVWHDIYFLSKWITLGLFMVLLVMLFTLPVYRR